MTDEDDEMKPRWPMVALGEVLRQYTSNIDCPEPREYPKLSVKLYGKGVTLDTPADGATLKMRRHQVAKAGQVILSEIWGKKGAIGFVPDVGDGARCTSHFFLFDVLESRLDRGWLRAVFRANYLQAQLDSEAKGTTGYAAVRPKHLLAASIPLPPLPEQRRIVAKIEQLAAKIEEARELHAESTSAVRAMDRSSVDQVYKELIAAHGTSPLSALCESITDGDHLTPTFTDGGVKFIFVGNVSTGTLHFEGCKYVARDYYDALKAPRKPVRGDVLYSAVGATLGVPAVVDVADEFCFQRHVAIIRPSRRALSSVFLWHMLRADTVFRQAWASTTGSAQPTVPLKAIKALPVPTAPLDQQRRIVEYLDGLQAKADALKAMQSQTVAELDALLPSILDRAFKGEL